MAAIYSVEDNIVFGSVAPKPLRGFPPGDVKIHIAPDDFVKATVHSENPTRYFHVEEVDGFWQPCFEQTEEQYDPRR